MKYSIIIPIYKNEASITQLIQTLETMNQQLDDQMEAVFVVDGSPDQSFMLLDNALENLNFSAQLLGHSRNFGSFPAIRSGLRVARGDYFAVMAADLQEPPELLLNFFSSLADNKKDVVIGVRNSRNDPFMTRLTSKLFWSLYRRFIVKEIPDGGVDIFGCNQVFKKQLLKLNENRSSLIALIFWLGYRREYFVYNRQRRQYGQSAWSFRKKMDYLSDSIFSFTDYPVRILTWMGLVGSIGSLFLGTLLLLGQLSRVIEVPANTILFLIGLFFVALNFLGLGIVGNYAWRGYENSKQRPLAIIATQKTNKVNH